MRIAVVGVGLIGGSVALAARQRLGAHVRGWDPNPETLARARENGAIDTAAPTLEEAVDDAEIAFIAAPVRAIPDLVTQVLRHAPSGCVVTDTGSTKGEIVTAQRDPRFVGGHPLAGAETAGVEHARADLFDGAVWYLTAAGADGEALARLSGLIEAIGANAVTIDAAVHDRLMALVSHLPHVLANALVCELAAVVGTQPAATGPSFRDATRVAGANTSVWTEIYMSNRDAVIDAIDLTVEHLAAVRRALEAGDADAIARWNDRAAAARAQVRG